MNMDEEVFRVRLRHLIDAGLIVDVSEEIVCRAIRELTKDPKDLSSKNARKNTNQGFRVQFTGEQFDAEKLESDLVRADQDAEYYEALKTMQRREKQEEKKRVEEERQHEKIFTEMLSIKKCAEYIGEEPSEGIKLFIRMPSNKHINRIFDPEDPGSNIYTFIAAQDEMFDKDFRPKKFELESIQMQGRNIKIVLAVWTIEIKWK